MGTAQIRLDQISSKSFYLWTKQFKLTIWMQLCWHLDVVSDTMMLVRYCGCAVVFEMFFLVACN